MSCRNPFLSLLSYYELFARASLQAFAYLKKRVLIMIVGPTIILFYFASFILIIQKSIWFFFDKLFFVNRMLNHFSNCQANHYKEKKIIEKPIWLITRLFNSFIMIIIFSFFFFLNKCLVVTAFGLNSSGLNFFKSIFLFSKRNLFKIWVTFVSQLYLCFFK